MSKNELEFLNISAANERRESVAEAVAPKTSEQNNAHNNILAKASKNVDKEEPEETEELIAKGKMQKSILSKYLRSGNSILFLMLTLLFFIFAQVVRSGSDYFLAYW